VDSHEAVAKS
jgi:hypothetical protein